MNDRKFMQQLKDMEKRTRAILDEKVNPGMKMLNKLASIESSKRVIVNGKPATASKLSKRGVIIEFDNAQDEADFYITLPCQQT